MHHNKLKKLPDSLGNLKRLQTLNISHNCLKELPDTLSNLKRLKTLDLSFNPKLKKVPPSLAHCHSLENLGVADGNTQLQYPPQDICKQGTEAIMKLLSKGKGGSTTDKRLPFPVQIIASIAVQIASRPTVRKWL